MRYEYSAKMTIECKAGAARTLRFDASAWAPAGGEVDVNVVKNVSRKGGLRPPPLPAPCVALLPALGVLSLSLI